MNAVTEPSLEAVAVEQRHEKLEVLLLAVMRRRRHEQEVAADLAELLADLIAPRIFDLAAEIGRRHTMRFVADDEVPFARGHELLLQLFIARQHVETDDQAVAIREWIARTRGFDHVAAEDVELEGEFLAEFVLPLLDQAARRDDEATFEIASRDQLLHQQPGHDGLTSARVIGEEKAQRLARQHLAIDRRNLVRQRIDQARMDREIRVEIMRKLDAVGLCHQTQQRAVGVEGPGPAALHHLQPMLVVPIEHRFRDPTIMVAKDDIDRLVTDPVDGYDLNRLRRCNAANGRAVLYVLELCPHYLALPPDTFTVETPPSAAQPRFLCGLV